MWSKSPSVLSNNNHFDILWTNCNLMQESCQIWPCAPWLMMPPKEWKRHDWGHEGSWPYRHHYRWMSEGSTSLVLLVIGLIPTLKRYSAALAWTQLRGSHTFDVLVGTSNDIHSDNLACRWESRTVLATFQETPCSSQLQFCFQNSEQCGQRINLLSKWGRHHEDCEK